MKETACGGFEVELEVETGSALSECVALTLDMSVIATDWATAWANNSASPSFIASNPWEEERWRERDGRRGLCAPPSLSREWLPNIERKERPWLEREAGGAERGGEVSEFFFCRGCGHMCRGELVLLLPECAYAACTVAQANACAAVPLTLLISLLRRFRLRRCRRRYCRPPRRRPLCAPPNHPLRPAPPPLPRPHHTGRDLPPRPPCRRPQP